MMPVSRKVKVSSRLKLSVPGTFKWENGETELFFSVVVVVDIVGCGRNNRDPPCRKYCRYVQGRNLQLLLLYDGASSKMLSQTESHAVEINDELFLVP